MRLILNSSRRILVAHPGFHQRRERSSSRPNLPHQCVNLPRYGRSTGRYSNARKPSTEAFPKRKRRSLFNFDVISLQRDMASVVAVSCPSVDRPGGTRAEVVPPLRDSTIKPDRDPSAWRRCGPASCRRFRSARPRWPRCWPWWPPEASDWPRPRCSPDRRWCTRRPAAMCGWTCHRCNNSTWSLEHTTQLCSFASLAVSTCKALLKHIARTDSDEFLSRVRSSRFNLCSFN